MGKGGLEGKTEAGERQSKTKTGFCIDCRRNK